MRPIVRKLAKKVQAPAPAVADSLDGFVHAILTKLRAGQTAAVPGLGKFIPGPQTTFEPERWPETGNG